MRRWFLRFATRVIVTSQRLLDNTPILQPFREKCSIVPLGIDLGRFAPTPAVEEEARRLRERFPGPIVLFIGRLIPYKGLEYLIPAMKGVEANLLIIGEGRLHGELEEITRKHGLENQVHFEGAVSDESVVAHLHASDCLVLPSVMNNEAFGIVQLEAMVCGKPVICSNLPTGVPYVNQHEKTGLVVPPRDTEAIRQAILRLLGNDAERKTFGENARRRVYEEFGAELMVSRVLEIYNEVLSK
jgi:rhamnosyl/mannosyltransferase